MTVDISRKTFIPRNNYSELVSMQGRVVTDAPLNEAEKIVDRRFRTQILDLVGRCGYPATLPESFRIDISAGELTIGAGRYYVDGLTGENFGAGAEVFDVTLDELHGVDAVLFNDQPYRPGFSDTSPEDGRHLLYLDVWRREITFLEDPDLIDPAIGVDTTARMQTVWQVRRLGGLGTDISCETPDGDIPGWLDIIQPSNARLSSRANPDSAILDPCLVPPGGGYLALDNRSYLICIHDILPDGTRLMKWSRNNGTIATEILGQPAADTLSVARVAKDDFLRFNPGDWVELTDDVRVLGGQPGTMARVLSVDDATDTIVLDDPLPPGTVPLDGGGPQADRDLHPLIRRWDQSGIVLDTDGVQIVDLDAAGSGGLIPLPALGTFIALEDGVEVALDLDIPGGEMHIGDCWCFTTRYADASVEELNEAPPNSTHHHYCRLALVDSLNGEFIAPVVSDCRDPISEDSCCTVIVHPGEDIQAAINSLPDEFGGCICLKPGIHEVSSTVQILTSNITLHGESHGVLLRNTGDGPVIQIGDAANPVSGIHITTLDLRQTRNSDDLQAALQLRSVFNSVIEDCQVVAASDSESIGIILADCTEVGVQHCLVSNVLIGIMADIGGEHLSLFSNRVENVNGAGLVGIAIGRVLGQVIIRQNQISHFANGILVNASLFDMPRFSNARGSIIENNTIELALLEGFDDQQAGINTACDDCSINGNRILLAGSQLGIRVSGSTIKVGDNIIDVQGGADASESTGIFIGQFANGAGVDASFSTDITAKGNSISATNIGISAREVSDLRIINSNIRGFLGEDQIGLQLENNDNSEIAGNRIRETGLAISSRQGRTTQFQMNQIETCSGGIFCDQETSVSVKDNRIEACTGGGVLFLGGLGRCATTGNRIANVSTTALVNFAIGGLFILGEFQAESNEILDTGVPLDGDINSNPVAGIIGLFVLEAQIESNLISYTNLLSVLRSVEDRALLLQGLFEFSIALGNQSLRFGFAAQISNNKFIGMGSSALVQLNATSVTDNFFIRFERVFFNHNYCDHFGGTSDNDSNATVKLTGFYIVVMGNQVKALNRAHASIDFDNRPGPSMGNATASFIINHVDFPVPNSSFNEII